MKCIIECCTFCFRPKATYKSLIYNRKCVRIHILNDLIDVVVAAAAATATVDHVSSLLKDEMETIGDIVRSILCSNSFHFFEKKNENTREGEWLNSTNKENHKH